MAVTVRQIEDGLMQVLLRNLPDHIAPVGFFAGKHIEKDRSYNIDIGMLILFLTQRLPRKYKVGRTNGIFHLIAISHLIHAAGNPKIREHGGAIAAQ